MSGLARVAADCDYSDVCTCGHTRGLHAGDKGADTYCEDCDECKVFVLAARAPVALADHGDHCVRCHRPLNINEPVYRDSLGVRCGGCNDAVPEPRPPEAVAAHVVDARPLAELRTSEVLRRCASLLLAQSLPGALADVARSHANELHARAFEIERVADHQDAGGGCQCGACNVLRAIGEVRS